MVKANGMWFMSLRLLLLAGVAVCDDPFDEPSPFYDQRQVGDTNVRVSVKDAVVIALGDEQHLGGDYDYSYDYSDFTIKPPVSMFPASSTHRPILQPSSVVTPTASKKTTTAATTSVKATSPQPPKESSTSETQSNTFISPISSEDKNASVTFPPRTNDSSSEASKVPANVQISAPHPDQIPVLVLQELLGSLPYKFLPLGLGKRAPLNRSAVNSKIRLRRNCSPGFFLDGQNRCKKIIQKSEKPQQ